MSTTADYPCLLDRNATMQVVTLLYDRKFYASLLVLEPETAYKEDEGL